jgi:acyl-CoA thioesterase
MADSILAAEYTVGSKRYPPTLYINRITDGRRSNVAAFNVSGKREARKLAKQQGAEPWNF